LLEMLFDRMGKFGGLGLLGHSWKLLDQLLFCIIDIFQAMYEKVLHGFEAHSSLLSSRGLWVKRLLEQFCRPRFCSSLAPGTLRPPAALGQARRRGRPSFPLNLHVSSIARFCDGPIAAMGPLHLRAAIAESGLTASPSGYVSAGF